MKKKIIILLLAILAFLLTFNSSYAYNLIYETEYDSDKDLYYFYTTVKSSADSRDYFLNKKNAIPGEFIEVNPSNYGTKFTSYNIMGIYFHDKVISKYDTVNSTSQVDYNNKQPVAPKSEIFDSGVEDPTKVLENIKISYTYKTWTDQSNYNNIYYDYGISNKSKSGDNYGFVNVSGIDNSAIIVDGDKLELNVSNGNLINDDSKYFKVPEYTLTTSDSSSSVIYRYAISGDFLRSEEINNIAQIDSKGKKYVYVSFTTDIGWPNVSLMKTSYDFYRKIFNPSSASVAEDYKNWLKNKTLINFLTQKKESLQNATYGQSEKDKYERAIDELDTRIGLLSSENDSLQQKNNNTFYENIENATFAPYVKGVDFNNKHISGYSAANDYDNILYLPESSSNLYVQYQLFSVDASKESDGIIADPEKISIPDRDNLKPTYVLKQEGSQNLRDMEREVVNFDGEFFEQYGLENDSIYHSASTMNKTPGTNGYMLIANYNGATLFDNGRIFYEGKEYVLVDFMQKTSYYNSNLREKIQEFAYSKYRSIKTNDFNKVYEGFSENAKKLTEDNNAILDRFKIEIGSENVTTIIRKAYIEIPIAMYVQYELLNLNSGEYDSDFVDLFKEEITLKNNRILGASKDGDLAKSVLKVKKIDESGKEIGDDLKEIHIDEDNADDKKIYKEQLEKQIYEKFNLDIGSTYKYSAKNTITLVDGNKSVKFYLAEYLAKIIDDPTSPDYILDYNVRENARKVIYSLEEYKGSPTNSEKYSSLITPYNYKYGFKVFLDAYKSLIRDSKIAKEESLATFIFNPKKYIETEEDKKGSYFKFEKGPYYTPANHVLRLTYIEVPVREAEVYVKYEFMTYSTEAKEMISNDVDLYGNDMKTSDGRIFSFAMEGQSEQIVIGQKINTVYTENADGEKEAHRSVVQKHLEPIYLGDSNNYAQQIQAHVYEKFNVPLDENIYRFSSQTSFGLEEVGLNRNVTFYLIDFLADCYSKGTVSEYITDKQDPDGKIREFVGQYVNRKISKYVLASNFKEANEGIDGSSKTISRFLDGQGAAAVTRYGYSEGITNDPIEIDEITSDSVESLLKTQEIKTTELLKLVYIEVPNIGDEIDTLQLKGLNLEGKLQFISLGNKQNFSFLETDKMSNYKDNDSYPFLNTTINEDTGNYDFIPTNEFIMPYATNVYSYVIRAMGWKAHEDDNRFSNNLEVRRSYEYTLRWLNDDGKLPTDSSHLISAGRGRPYIDYVKANKNLFYYESENSQGKAGTENLSYPKIDLKKIDLMSTIVKAQKEYENKVASVPAANSYISQVDRNEKLEQLKEEYEELLATTTVDVGGTTVTYEQLNNILNTVTNAVIEKIDDYRMNNNVFNYQYDSLFNRYKTDADTYYISQDSNTAYGNYGLNNGYVSTMNYGEDPFDKEYINKQLVTQFIYNYIYNNNITTLASQARVPYFQNRICGSVLELVHVSEVYKDYHESFRDDDPIWNEYKMLSQSEEASAVMYVRADTNNSSDNWTNALELLSESELRKSGALNARDYEKLERSDFLEGGWGDWDYANYLENNTYNGPYYYKIDDSLLFSSILNKNIYLQNTITNFIREVLSDSEMDNSYESYNFEKDNDYFIKYWFYDTSVCPYAKDESHAYGDHEHNESCCRGFKLDGEDKNTYDFKVRFSCNEIISYDAEYYLITETLKKNSVVSSNKSLIVKIPKGACEYHPNTDREVFLDALYKAELQVREALANANTFDEVHNGYGTRARITGSQGYGRCGTTYTITDNGTSSVTKRENFERNVGNIPDFSFEYNSANTVHHSTGEVITGKCAENTQKWDTEKGSYGETAWNSNLVPNTFKTGDNARKVAGSIKQKVNANNQPYTCYWCGTHYGGMLFGCTFFNVTKLLPLESSVNENGIAGNVEVCNNGYPYYKLPSCSSAFAEYCEGLAKDGTYTHKYFGLTSKSGETANKYFYGVYVKDNYRKSSEYVGVHSDETARCYQGHIHNANCYRTNQLDLNKLNDIATGKDIDENNVLKDEIIADSQDWDYKYWISPEGKNTINELILFTDSGFSFKDGDKTYTYNFENPKVTGIDCSDEKINDSSAVAKSIRRYSGSLYAKYYSIINFQLYKVASITLHSNDENRNSITKKVADENGKTQDKEVAFEKALLGNPAFTFKNSNSTYITPSDDYNKMFNTKENTLHSPLRTVNGPIIGTLDTFTASSGNKVLNMDIYADNLMQNSDNYVIGKYDDESFTQGRINYLISRGSSKKDFNNYDLGYPVKYSNELNYTKSLLQSGFDGSVINSSVKIKATTINSTNNNTTYSLGNYVSNIILIEAKEGDVTKYVPTTKERICESFKNKSEDSYKIEYVGNNRVYRLIIDGKPNTDYNLITGVLNLKDESGSTSDFVTLSGKYTGAGGQSGKRGDSFTGYRKDAGESSNMFLADSTLVSIDSNVSKLFLKKVQESVEAMSNTEAILRVGIAYEVKDYYNDYFTFTKAYGETLYGDPTKDGFTPGALDHHTRYTTNETSDDSLLNKNNAWGYVRYTYDYIDGMRVMVAHSEEKYKELLSKYNTAKKTNNLDTDPYFEDWIGNEKDSKKYRIAKYTNTVKSALELLNSYAFEDNLEYNLQQRKDTKISLNSIQFSYKDTSWQLIKQLTAFGVRLGKGNAALKMYYNPNNELNKIFDLTDFVNVGTEFDSKQTSDKLRIKEIGDSIKYANGNNITNTSIMNSLGGSVPYSYIGLKGTYYKNNYEYTYDSKSTGSDKMKELSEYTYTKNYDLYTDRAANTKKLDIYDWKLNSFETIASLAKDIKNGQKTGDGTGNGVRDFAFDVTYTLVDDNARLYRFNYGIDESDIVISGNTPVGNYTNYTEYGKITRTGADQVYMAEISFKGDDMYQRTIKNDDTFTTVNSNNTGSKIDILNPVKMEKVNITTIDLVSQEVEERNDGKIILGKNTKFQVRFVPGTSTANVDYNNGKGVDTKNYIKEYWIKCDFDVVCHGCVVHPNGGGYHPYEEGRNNIIRVANKGSETVFEGTTTASYGATAVGIGEREIIVYAASSNIPNKVIEEVISTGKFMDKEEVTYTGRNTGSMNQNLLYQATINDAYHVAYKTFETESTYRIFSFEITDFTDLSYKNIFRNGIQATNNYFAGRYQWDYNILDKDGNLIDFSNNKINLSTSNARIDRALATNYKDYGGGYILPVGPNSIAKTGYVYGPKLGYTFSFNFKTTGYFADVGKNLTSRKTYVKPSYYYISKEGKLVKDVELYYKDANGKYIKFADSGYKIAFKPNDGYRNLRFIDTRDYNGDSLSTELKYIDISSSNGFELDNQFMTTSFGNFMQTWYGEFKLPNSTMVVEKGKSPNEALTNGYIGVCFEILCKDENYVSSGKSLVVSYNQNDTGNITSRVDEDDPTRNYSNNTAQWDYDGMFGIDTVGRTGDITLKNGWEVTNEQWQKIKSTVVLYETDLRADDDFN